MFRLNIPINSRSQLRIFLFFYEDKRVIESWYRIALKGQ